MKILHNDKKIVYMGRREVTAEETRFFHAGSQAIVRFRGTRLDVIIDSTPFWGEFSLGVVIDGEVKSVPLLYDHSTGEVTITAAENLDDTVHDAVIYKRHAAYHTLFIRAFETDGEFSEPECLPDRKIEVYGDSVCAGEVIEADDFIAKCDPIGHNGKWDNAWYSFVMQTARNIGAQIHNICQGGIALFDGTGYFHAPEYIGLESTYDKICYYPEGGEITKWDFSSYIPDIVIIAIGQNDKHNGRTDADDIDITDVKYRRKWKNAYIKLVNDLNKLYGGVKFVLTTTILMHDAEWDKTIEEIKDELCSKGIEAYHNMFARNGAATPGHPRICEHNEMAEELTKFIEENVL